MGARSVLVGVATSVLVAGAMGPLPDSSATVGGEEAAPSVVVDSLTTATRLVRRDPSSGRFTAEISALPVRHQDPDGVWRAVDLTLEVRDGRVAPRRVPAEVNHPGFSGESCVLRRRSLSKG